MPEPTNKKESIFGNKDVNMLRSPDQLQNYISVTNPTVWVALLAIIVFLVGVLGWCAFGRIPLTIDTVIMSNGTETGCLVKTANIDEVEVGDTVTNGKQTLTVKEIVEEPYMFDTENIPSYEYVAKLGGFTAGEYVYGIWLEGDCPAGITSAKITVDYLSPISLILN